MTKLILKSKTANGVNLKVEGARSKEGAVKAFLETKLAHAGVSIKEKWTTDNDVQTELSGDNPVLAGGKLTAEATFNPSKGFRDLKLKSDYAQSAFNTTVAINSKGVVSTSGVFGFHSKYFLGGSADYDTSKGVVGDHKVALSYVEKDLTVTTTITNGTNVEGSIFHVPNAFVYAGLKFNWSKLNSDVGFQLAGKYFVDNTTFYKVKLDKNLVLGLSYTQPLRPGVSATLSAEIRGTQLQSDNHLFGFALTFE